MIFCPHRKRDPLRDEVKKLVREVGADHLWNQEVFSN